MVLQSPSRISFGIMLFKTKQEIVLAPSSLYNWQAYLHRKKLRLQIEECGLVSPWGGDHNYCECTSPQRIGPSRTMPIIHALGFERSGEGWLRIAWKINNTRSQTGLLGRTGTVSYPAMEMVAALTRSAIAADPSPNALCNSVGASLFQGISLTAA